MLSGNKIDLFSRFQLYAPAFCGFVRIWMLRPAFKVRCRQPKEFLLFYLTDIPSQPCRFGNKSYSEGEQIDRYQPTDNIENAFCEACKCSQGKFDCKKKWYCDIDLKACDEYHFPDGSCCPECKLPCKVHNLLIN